MGESQTLEHKLSAPDSGKENSERKKEFDEVYLFDPRSVPELNEPAELDGIMQYPVGNVVFVDGDSHYGIDVLSPSPSGRDWERNNGTIIRVGRQTLEGAYFLQKSSLTADDAGRIRSSLVNVRKGVTTAVGLDTPQSDHDTVAHVTSFLIPRIGAVIGMVEDNGGYVTRGEVDKRLQASTNIPTHPNESSRKLKTSIW